MGEQHMGHVFKQQGRMQLALDMYLQSVATFELMGTAKFDTEHACSLSSVADVLLEMWNLDIWDHDTGSPWPAVVAYAKSAVVSCEAITGKSHVEAIYYRRILARYLTW